MNQYIIYNEVTKDILNSIKKGDYVKCNNWKKGMPVVGVSENYFVLARKAFDDTIYCICEKNPINHTRNNYTKNSFRIGTDDLVFGYIGGYDFDNEEIINSYLNDLETGKFGLSVRRAVDLNSISIKTN